MTGLAKKVMTFYGLSTDLDDMGTLKKRSSTIEVLIDIYDFDPILHRQCPCCQVL